MSDVMRKENNETMINIIICVENTNACVYDRRTNLWKRYPKSYSEGIWKQQHLQLGSTPRGGH
jgi:hypothetical protein